MTRSREVGRGRAAPELSLEMESVGGRMRVLIGGARALRTYSQRQVEIQLRGGRLAVLGDRLELILLSDGRMQLLGEVEEIKLEKEN